MFCSSKGKQKETFIKIEKKEGINNSLGNSDKTKQKKTKPISPLASSSTYLPPDLWLGTPCIGERCNISPDIYLVLFRRIRVILGDPSLPPLFFGQAVTYNSN